MHWHMRTHTNESENKKPESIKSTRPIRFFKRPQKVSPLMNQYGSGKKPPVRSIYFHCCSKFLLRSFTNCTWHNRLRCVTCSIPFRSTVLRICSSFRSASSVINWRTLSVCESMSDDQPNWCRTITGLLFFILLLLLVVVMVLLLLFRIYK